MTKVGMRYFGPAWTLALPLAAATAVLAAPPEQRLLSVLVTAPTYTLMQHLMPGSRFRRNQQFFPINLALLLFLLKLVIVPILIMQFGPETKLPIAFAPQAAMEKSIALDLVAFVAFSLGLQFVSGRTINLPGLQTALARTPAMGMAVLFLLVGLVGFFCVFKTPGRFIEYFTQPLAAAEIREEMEQAGSISGLLGTVLRPFFAFSLVVWWANVVDHSSGPSRSWKAAVSGLVAALGITLANSTYSFNRAAFVFPVLCLAAVYSSRVRRIPFAFVVTILAVLLPLLTAIQTYRTQLMAPPNASEMQDTGETSLRDFAEQIEIYAGGPQITGVFYENIGWGEHLYYGSTLISSFLTPVPLLGKGFRENNGPTLYNYVLYGVPEIQDQIFPYVVELFANWHIPGVVGGFIALGCLLGTGEHLFATAKSVFGAFVLQYAFLWTSLLTVWSVSVYAQILVFFFDPIYLYVTIIGLRTWLRRTNQAHPPVPSRYEAIV